MIYYPLEAMANAGIREVLISSSPDHSGDFANLLKDGQEFGLRLYYAVQQNAKGGIANAIALAEEFAKNDKLLVILGDNIFNINLKPIKDLNSRINKLKRSINRRQPYFLVSKEKTIQLKV